MNLRPSVVGLAVLAQLLVACSTPPPPDQTQLAWKAEIERARAQAADDLTRQILADGRVTDAERLESYDAFVRCAADRGVTVSITRNQGRITGYSALAGKDEELDACSKGRIAVVDTLYNDMRLNPKHEDPSEVLARCLRTNGLAPGITKQDLEQQQAAGKFQFNQDDPRFAECVT